MASPMLEFRTPGFNPYAVRYSPYIDSRVAVATSANFGIVGNGKLFVLGLGPQGIAVERAYVYFFFFLFLIIILIQPCFCSGFTLSS